jgi:hypothetical protein
MDRFEAAHVCGGRNLIRLPETIDLRDDPAAWSAVWAELRDELLPQFIAENPGRRPAAFWTWDAPEDVDLDEESEVEVLHAAGLLSDEEIEAITARARQFIASGVDDFYGFVAFAAKHDLLTPAEIEALDQTDDDEASEEAFDDRRPACAGMTKCST